MELRVSEENDTAAVLAIFAQGIAKLKADGVPQWQDGYPNAKSVADDRRRGVGRVLTQGVQIVGYAALIFGDEPSYREIFGGAWLTAGTPYVTVHRSVIASHSERGTADTLFRLLEAESQQKLGARSLRIDTHEKNMRMQKLLARMGYTLCGTIILADTGESRLAFEKILG